jgi:VWFA-related protein
MPLSRRSLLQSAIGAFVPQEAARFSTDLRVVTLFATVRDRHGRIVHDLSKEDFRLEESGRPRTIRYFSRESDLPLKIGILVDTSRSQYGILERERRASYTFLDRILREDKDTAVVIKFDVVVTMLQEFTSSRQPTWRSAARTKPNPRAPIFWSARSCSIPRDTMRAERGRRLRQPY